MEFHPPLQEARLERRYKRFFADVRFDNGEEVVAHCPNPGSMLGLAQPGRRVWLSYHDSPKRKLKWSWELVETEEGALVGVHTGKANDLVDEALRDGRIKELSGFETLTREVRVSEKSRIDFQLSKPKTPQTYVEVKSVTLSRSPALAEFPDSKTARGVKHLQELSRLVEEGFRAVLLYVAQREDCRRFAPARDIDPAYFQAMQEGARAGVEILCYDCAMSARGIRIKRRLPVELS